MHVVQALVALNLGGSELVAVELSEYLQQQGHRCTVIAADGVLGDRVRAGGAQLLDWPIGRKRLSTLGYIKRLAEWFRQERPDVVHAHSRLPAWICHLAIRRLPPEQRPKWITTVHGHYSVSRYSAIMASGDRSLAVSDAIRRYTLNNYRKTDPARLITVSGGISHRDFPHGYQPDDAWWQRSHEEFPELRNKRLICLPGRLSRYKGHVTFIELLARLSRDFSDIHAIIVGVAKPGSRYRDELEGLAERYGVQDQLTFTGAKTDMRDWLASAEIVYSLCADPPEAFGRTVPEALFLGVPVIGWDHGGVHETLTALFPQGAVPGGDHEQLYQRSRAFLQHKPTVPPGTAYGLEESMRKTLDVYRAVMAEETA